MSSALQCSVDMLARDLIQLQRFGFQKLNIWRHKDDEIFLLDGLVPMQSSVYETMENIESCDKHGIVCSVFSAKALSGAALQGEFVNLYQFCQLLLPHGLTAGLGGKVLKLHFSGREICLDSIEISALP